MKTIVVGYDGARPSERALRRAAELAKAFGSTVVVVSAAMDEPVQPLPGAFGLSPYYAIGADQIMRTDEALWERHRTEVDSFLSGAGVEHEFAGVIGQPTWGIVEVAEQRDADLIVVGTRRPGFLDRLLEGSVSQGVAKRAGCDVLIVHPGDDADETA